MGKRTDLLINLIRSTTQNELANSTTDIGDDEIISYLNEGQNRIQAKITMQHPDMFQTEIYVDAVSYKEEYLLPANMMLGSKILSVEYTTTSASAHPIWYPVKVGSRKYRRSDIASVPVTYYRRELLSNKVGSIVVSPPPNDPNGQFRINYIQKLDKVDIRRGVVKRVTLDSPTMTITSLQLDLSGDPTVDFTALAEVDFICIVDKYGDMQMRNIPFSIDTTTGIVTVDPSFTYQAGESIVAGNYVTAGIDVSTHSSLSDDIERYIIQFAVYKIFKHDSSSDVSVQLNELKELEDEIVSSYQMVDEDSPDVIVTEEWDNFWG